MSVLLSQQQPLKKTVFLVDDHSLVRDGLRVRLSLVPQFEIVGEANNATEALGFLEHTVPDLMLLDINMKGMTGIELTVLIREKYPTIGIILLSMYDSVEFVKKGMLAGAKAYVLKDAPFQEVIAALDAVALGETYLSEGVNHVDIQKTDQKQILTERELEVLKYLASGLCNKKIAKLMNISTRTVETHRFNLRHKLDIDSSAGLIKYALANNLTT